jgi:hypothetical protein
MFLRYDLLEEVKTLASIFIGSGACAIEGLELGQVVAVKVARFLDDKSSL